MQLSDLKLITASNIIRLRNQMGLTQADLAAKLNYSDKSISKWERGEAVPDTYVILQMAEIFGVSTDYMLSSHDQWEQLPEQPAEQKPVYSSSIIILLAIVCVATAALTVFVTLWMLGIAEWRILLVGLSTALLTTIILVSVLQKGKHLQYIIALFVLSLFVLAFFFIGTPNAWQIFLIAIPAEAIVFLSCNMKKKPLKLREIRTSKK